MNFHVEWSTLGWTALAMWWLVLPAIAVILSRAVTPPPARLASSMSRNPGPLDLATETVREWTWRRCGRLLWLVAGQLSGGRARWVRRWSGNCTRRGALLEFRRLRRENADAVLDAKARAWARTLASSISSPAAPPPRPRPALDFSAEETTRWSPPGRSYPFAPMSPPAAPSSGRRSRRTP